MLTYAYSLLLLTCVVTFVWNQSIGLTTGIPFDSVWRKHRTDQTLYTTQWSLIRLTQILSQLLCAVHNVYSLMQKKRFSDDTQTLHSLPNAYTNGIHTVAHWPHIILGISNQPTNQPTNHPHMEVIQRKRHTNRNIEYFIMTQKQFRTYKSLGCIWFTFYIFSSTTWLYFRPRMQMQSSQGTRDLLLQIRTTYMYIL